MQDLDLHDKIRNVVGIVDADIRGKQLGLSLDLQATRWCAHGDGARLQQVLWNLLKNAIKFTPFGGRIWIESADGPNGRIVLTIRDSGTGIEPDVLPRLFNAFEQGSDGVTRTFGGLGLGLSIARGLLEMHGGTIRAFSEGKDRGAAFTIELPATAKCPEHPSTPDEPQLVDAQHAARVLFVEDHPDTSRAMIRLLKHTGYSVHAADTVAAALRIAESEPFDVLVSDIGLPDGSGLDLMRQLRGAHPHLRGIALSGFGMEEDVERSRAAGFDEHLTKPINLTAFEETLARLTESPVAGSRL